MFEIWRHVTSSQWYLVLIRDRQVIAVAGPMAAHEHPHRVLEAHANQRHNPQVLLHARYAPTPTRRNSMA